MTRQFIVWDLGATKCLAGIVEYNRATHALVCKKSFAVKLKQSRSLEDLIDQLEAGLGMSMREADAICIGAAGQYDGRQLLLEGVYPYPMHIHHMAKVRNWPKYAVIHDYAPIVCATFTSYMEQSKNLKRINDCQINPYGRRVALGIGTGLGLKDGVLLPNGDFWLGKNEMGHIGISTPPAASHEHLERHKELIKFLQTNYLKKSGQPITFEKILSGSGTARLFQFFYPDTKVSSPEEVGEHMRSGKVNDMLDAFAWYIGLFIGTVELIFMPEGGTWITGGVSISHLDVFDRPDLLAGIAASPAYALQREEYPIGVMCNQEHALIGSGYYAARKLTMREMAEESI